LYCFIVEWFASAVSAWRDETRFELVFVCLPACGLLRVSYVVAIAALCFSTMLHFTHGVKVACQSQRLPLARDFTCVLVSERVLDARLPFVEC